MKRTRSGCRWLLMCLGLGLLLSLPTAHADDKDVAVPRPKQPDPAAAAKVPEICPLDMVTPGLKGYGLTVMHGTEIERFEVEVIDVIPGFLAKQSLILVRCLGEAFADHQVVQGMSGSPIYFHGKIAGALSYTWDWAKHPLAGVTPIETMLAEGARPLEGRPNGAEAPTPLRRKDRPAAPSVDESTGLRPIGTPVTCSGYGPEARADILDALRGIGMHAVDGGAVGRPGARPWQQAGSAKLEPGAAMVVELVRGDFQVATIGTCTFVDGDTVYGFGHPFQTLGETLFPMSVGYVYMTVASRKVGFKMGGALEQVGAIVQDRPSGVVGHLGRKAFMLPCDVRFTNPVTKREEHFRFEIAHNRHVLGKMLVASVQEAFRRAETTLGHNTKHFDMTLKVEGMDPWRLTGSMGGFDGGFQRALIHLVDRILNNTKQRAKLEWFKLHVDVEHTDRRARITNATAGADEVRAGEEVELFVTLEKRDGGEAIRERLRVRIPDDAPAGNYAIKVTSGDFVADNAAEPRDLADLPKFYESYYTATQLVVVLPTSRVDVDVDGRLLRGLPVSSIPRLARSPGGQKLKLKPVTKLVTKDVPYVVAGSFTLMLRVAR
ncbi:MAG: SpoIVB peptidase S55 domain-containing protein [Planctomycetota bacterium]|nr:SpoIVB peptidase S55 domain-containing protein [Planctomycetota bacterium]